MFGGIQKRFQSFLREIVFGLEDSLVSTLGPVTGVAVGTGSTFVVILSGTVLIFVEGLSMSAGSYLSSKSAREVFELRRKQNQARVMQERVNDNASLYDALVQKGFSKSEIEEVSKAVTKERSIWMKEVARCEYRFAPAASSSPASSGVVMGVFYLAGGIFPLFPYFFLPVFQAIVPSIIITGVVLFFLGVLKARVVQGHPLKSGLEMTVVSLTASIIGFAIARIISVTFGIEPV